MRPRWIPLAAGFAGPREPLITKCANCPKSGPDLRVRPSILRCAGEPYNSAQHEPDHCENDECDMAAGEVLIVFCKSAAATKPAVGTLNDPALGKYKKTLDHI
jgi:hypothetical protein